MKKMFVAFGIAVITICGVFAVMSAQKNADAVEWPEVEEQLEQSFTEKVYEEYPESSLDYVDVMYVDSDPLYGGCKVAFVYELNGYAGFSTVSLNSLMN